MNNFNEFQKMEKSFSEERKLMSDNSAAQNKRQLGFMDQLIKDKESLGLLNNDKLINCLSINFKN